MFNHSDMLIQRQRAHELLAVFFDVVPIVLLSIDGRNQVAQPSGYLSHGHAPIHLIHF
jgi:hypothetical protein